MRILLKEFENNTVTLFVERENGKYNNFEQSIQFNQSDIDDLSRDQIITKAWLQVKPNALLTFDRVWQCRVDEDAESTAISPFDEVENPVGFKIVEIPPPPPPQPSEVDLLKAEVFKQNQAMSDLLDILFTNVPELQTFREENRP